MLSYGWTAMVFFNTVTHIFYIPIYIWERAIFSTMLNSKRNCICVHLNLCMFRLNRGRTNIVCRIAAGMPRNSAALYLLMHAIFICYYYIKIFWFYYIFKGLIIDLLAANLSYFLLTEFIHMLAFTKLSFCYPSLSSILRM